MELFAADPGDDPDWLDSQMADFTQSGRDIDSLLAAQRAEYASAWQRLEARFPNKIAAIRHRLDTIAAAARNREAVRSEVTRLGRLVRIFLLKAGVVSELSNGIFFLSLDEMASVLGGDRLPGQHDSSPPRNIPALLRPAALPSAHHWAF